MSHGYFLTWKLLSDLEVSFTKRHRKDQLAENLNLMLGRIEELIGEVKQVADQVARASGTHTCATGRRLCVAR
jgi:methyl-accepting chemotaxis protein